MERITQLVPPRSPDGLALIAATEGRDQPARVYLATLKPGGRWEPQTMPPAWRAALVAMGLNVPAVP